MRVPVTHRRPAVLALVGLIALVLCAAAGDPAQPPLPTRPAIVFDHGPRSRPVVALTFDDGWSPGATANILRILQVANAPATFFPQSDGVRKDPALWRRIAGLGYPIGDHTVDHPDLTTLSTARVLQELSDSRTEIEAIIGQPMAPIARPPYGQADERVLRAMRASGFPTVVLWDAEGAEWAHPDAAGVAADALSGQNGSIVLLHAGPPTTVDALPAIIAGYRARGFQFVTVPGLLGLGW
jgi:peptidoglycan/xylan/chitin deacetylase (PgdA/CDA1 family)